MATSMPHGYRSATEYCSDKEHSDAIIRTTAYHRRDFCLSVIWYPPREHVDIRSSIATPFQRTSNAGLGPLDRLPLELLFDTLCCLDMLSLFKFRQTNTRARQLVDSTNQYQRVVVYGLNLFCALLRTRLAIDISLLDFDNALCMKTCSLCGEFSGFISLPTWKRCCFKCLQRSPETQLRTFASVRRRLHLTKSELNELKAFRSLPGTYSMNESVQNSRIAIVSLHQATSARGRQSNVLTQSQRTGFDQCPKYNYMGSCALPYYDKRTGKVERGISCAGCQLAVEKGIIGTNGAEWGYDARDKVYAQDGFLEHFRWCEQAQILWRSSHEGTKQPPELPVAARMGGYFGSRE